MVYPKGGRRTVHRANTGQGYLLFSYRKDGGRNWLTAQRRPAMSPGNRTSEEAEKTGNARLAF